VAQKNKLSEFLEREEESERGQPWTAHEVELIIAD
jgi:hypothetical protein